MSGVLVHSIPDGNVARLGNIVGLDEGHAGGVVRAADDGGVVAGGQVMTMADSRSSAGGMPVALLPLSVAPVVVRGEEDAIHVV